jgi:hypothetical protein
MTPAQLMALIDRHRIDTYRKDLRSGVIASIIANVNRGKDQKAFSPHDFMPKSSIIQDESDHKETTPGQLMRKFMQLTGAKRRVT